MEEIIKVHNFTKKYGKVKGVDNINFSIRRGEIVGFVGENGAGKSTTIRCITNMLFPTEGEIKVFDLDAAKEGKEIKQYLSYLPSEVEFYKNITPKELFKITAKLNKASYEKAVELSKYFGFDMNKKVRTLSLGNRKKVSIIITLMKEAQLIIMDEPANGLDPLMQNKFFDLLLKEVEKGATVFLSSHNLREVQKYCDRALIIKEGKLIDDLNIKEINRKRKQEVLYKVKGEEIICEDVEDINKLVKRLSTLELDQLEIRYKSIEDQLLDYYKGGEKNV